MNGKDIQQQAKYIWDRLDDLAETDPDGYKKFIEQQMKERETFMAPPEPRLCFHVKTEEQDNVYVNLCAWKRIPYPENDSEPLKLMCGFLRKYSATKDHPKHITVPVASNEKVLDEILANNFDKHELINLILDLITKQFKLNVLKKYELCKAIYKGDLPANPRSLFIKNPNAEFSESELMKMASKTPDNLLSSPEKLLKNLNLSDETDDNVAPEPDLMKSFMKKKEKQSTKLIEEIEEKPLEPKYTLTETTTKTEIKQLVLMVDLPLLDSTSNCDLLISKNKIELNVPGRYALNVELPTPINDDEAKAKFSKKAKQLTINMCIL